MNLTSQDIMDMTEGLRKTKRKDWKSATPLKGDNKIVEDWLEQEDAYNVAKSNSVSTAYVYRVIKKRGLI